jgi:hypothetical protein
MNQVKKIFEYDPTLGLTAITFLMKMQRGTKQKKGKVMMHPSTRDFLNRKCAITNAPTNPTEKLPARCKEVS